jgi:hypothetical protein
MMILFLLAAMTRGSESQGKSKREGMLATGFAGVKNEVL